MSEKEIPTTEEMIAVINSYTEFFCITTLPSGMITADIKYGNRQKNIGGFYLSEDETIRASYIKLRQELIQKCFIINHFKPKA